MSEGQSDDEQAASSTARRLSSDERSAIRAYLQRSEVRLSTSHRVASALLSGAGLMVLLPTVARDSVVGVMHALLRAPVSTTDGLLLVAVGASLALPFVALLFLLRDLTQFYFHAHHIGPRDGGTFAPRFTLTALRLPSDELSPAAARVLEEVRQSAGAIELLVPANETARRRLDRRLAVYDLGGQDIDDHERATALFTLAASQPRSLVEEVAKIEHGMARHVLRTQTVVLRYVKALLALLTTAVAVFAAAEVVEGTTALIVADQIWLASIMVLWAPAVIAAVTAPVRWLDSQLRGEGADQTAVSSDPELTHVEAVTIRLALIGALAAALALATAVVRPDASTAARGWGSTVLLLAVAGTGHVLRRWAGRSALVRVFRR